MVPLDVLCDRGVPLNALCHGMACCACSCTLRWHGMLCLITDCAMVRHMASLVCLCCLYGIPLNAMQGLLDIKSTSSDRLARPSHELDSRLATSYIATRVSGRVTSVV